jgi:hypothetical protein
MNKNTRSHYNAIHQEVHSLELNEDGCSGSVVAAEEASNAVINVEDAIGRS